MGHIGRGPKTGSEVEMTHDDLAESSPTTVGGRTDTPMPKFVKLTINGT